MDLDSALELAGFALLFSAFHLLLAFQGCLDFEQSQAKLLASYAEARRRRRTRKGLRTIAFHLSKKQKRRPKCWMKNRLALWFELEAMDWWEEDRWVENFRMSKRSFRKLCDLLKKFGSKWELSEGANFPRNKGSNGLVPSCELWRTSFNFQSIRAREDIGLPAHSPFYQRHQ